MPAIMIRPAVGSSEKVSGRIRATPATGPRPGSTPIAVPANAPAKAASKLAGVAAMLNPYSRPWSEFILAPSFRGTRLRVDPGIQRLLREILRCAVAHQSSRGRAPRNDGILEQPLPEHAPGHLHF